jgi:hypothetical protein
VTGIKDEKLVLWVLVEQLKDTDRREGCIVGSGRATEGYRPYRRAGHKERIILKRILIECHGVD